MKHQPLFIIVSLITFAFSGCYLRPNLGPPGTIGMQRSRAVLHDPYPIDELGPAVIGGRPRGFDRPQSEATNLQEVRGSIFGSNSNFQSAPGQATVPGPTIQPGFSAPPSAYPQYQPNF